MDARPHQSRHRPACAPPDRLRSLRRGLREKPRMAWLGGMQPEATSARTSCSMGAAAAVGCGALALVVGKGVASRTLTGMVCRSAIAQLLVHL